MQNLVNINDLDYHRKDLRIIFFLPLYNDGTGGIKTVYYDKIIPTRLQKP